VPVPSSPEGGPPRDAVLKTGMEHGAAVGYDRLAELLALRNKQEN